MLEPVKARALLEDSIKTLGLAARCSCGSANQVHVKLNNFLSANHQHQVVPPKQARRAPRLLLFLPNILIYSIPYPQLAEYTPLLDTSGPIRALVMMVAFHCPETTCSYRHLASTYKPPPSSCTLTKTSTYQPGFQQIFLIGVRSPKASALTTQAHVGTNHL